MKNKIIKIVFCLIIFCALAMITVSVNAATVKENVDDFSSDVYIIGSTKFDSNVVVTATRAARAGLDEAKLNLALGKDISRLDVTTYYYSETFGEWYQIEDTGFEELTTEEVADLENNLDIFFVNNEEKILEFPYAGTVDEGSITDGVTYDGTKFKVPATTFSFEFTSSGVEQIVETEKVVENKEENLEYGSFYIPYIVGIYDAIGGTQIASTKTTKDNFIYQTGLFDYKKDGYKLVYTDETGAEIDFATKTVSGSYNIYQKWIPVGKIDAATSTYDALKLTYNGVVALNDNEENAITVKLYAPDGYNTSNTTINGFADGFDALKTEENCVEIPLVFTNKDEVKTIKVTWEDGVTTTFEVVLGTDAKFERLVKYYNNTKELGQEKVLDGEKIKGLETEPTKNGYLFAGWSLNDKVYDVNTLVTSNMTLKTIFKELPVNIDFAQLFNVKIGEITEFTAYMDPKGLVNETVTVTADITQYNSNTKTYDTISYDENNYLQIYVNNEWKAAKDVPITLGTNIEGSAIQFRILLTDKIPSLTQFYICYTAKVGDKEILHKRYGSKQAIAEEDIVAEYNNHIYGTAQISTLTSRKGEIKLVKDVTLSTPLTFSSPDITLNLNGHTMTAKDAQTSIVVREKGADVTIKNGKIIAQEGNTTGAIQVGRTDTSSLKNIHLTIESDVTIIGENYGIGVFGNGTVLDFKGKMELSGDGSYGITGNASRKGQNTTVNIHEGAAITASKGFAFYLPQTGELNIFGGTITANTVIGVKAGKININGGTLTATGAKAEPVRSDNGIDVPTGDVILAEVNDTYEKNIEINVTGGTLASTNGNIIQVFKSNSTDDVTVRGLYSASIDLKNVMNTQSGTFVDTYYNKYSKQTLGAEDIDDSIYYVNLGKYTGSENPTELSIGNNKYGTESKSISIGNYAFIEVPVWKIANGNILVALPWLSTDSLPVGETEITVSGQTVKIIAYTSIADKKLTLQSVGATSTVGDHTNEITITNASKNEVTYNTGYGSHIGGLNITDTEGNLITDPSVLIFRKDIDGNAAITKPEDGFSYSFYPFPYENSAFTKEENRVLNYKLAFIGKGVIEVTINCNKVVD